MAKWLNKLESWIGGGPGGEKRIRTFYWLLLIGLVGITLLIFNSFMSVKQVGDLNSGSVSIDARGRETFLNKEPQDALFKDYEIQYESKLKDILENIIGVGEVDVLVTIESTEEIVVDRNRKDTEQITEEKDQSGATRHITEVTRSGEVVLYEASGLQTPIVLKKIKPHIRGVVVVAKGAEKLVVKKLITEAVERGLGVPAYRISIVPRKQ